MVAFSIQGSFKKIPDIDSFYKSSIEIYTKEKENILDLMKKSAAHLLDRYVSVHILITKTDDYQFKVNDIYLCKYNKFKLNLGVKEVILILNKDFVQ